MLHVAGLQESGPTNPGGRGSRRAAIRIFGPQMSQMIKTKREGLHFCILFICDNLRHLRTIALAIFSEPFYFGRALLEA
jgi:hypothetical protein